MDERWLDFNPGPLIRSIDALVWPQFSAPHGQAEQIDHDRRN